MGSEQSNPANTWIALQQVCRQVCNETAPLLFQLNEVLIEAHELSIILACLGRRRAEAVRHCTVTLSPRVYGGSGWPGVADSLLSYVRALRQWSQIHHLHIALPTRTYGNYNWWMERIADCLQESLCESGPMEVTFVSTTYDSEQ